ncbi:uncharacterized protein LOC125661545 [Ostrea edulis]|uniref:uncharacterized protein LOC125661545 n=1 Tax=Ostrea edulis TaxID=37623 RepID=UPI0024AF258D|nr:uncharacterized protein LOC125661545 [Ostrea edulis]
MVEPKRKRSNDEACEVEEKKPRLEIPGAHLSGNSVTLIPDDADLPESSSVSDGPENVHQQTVVKHVDSTGVEINVYGDESKPCREISIECLNTESKCSTLDAAAVCIPRTTRTLSEDPDGKYTHIEISKSTWSLNDQKFVVVEDDVVLDVEEMSGENVLLHSSNIKQSDVKDDVEKIAMDDVEEVVKDGDEEVAKDGDEEVAKDDVENDVKDDVENDAKEEQDVSDDIDSSLQDVEKNIDREDDQHHVDDHTEEILNNDINVNETMNKTTVALGSTETKDDDVQIDSTLQ